MKTKSNVILILSTLSFVLLILGKPTFNTTKQLLINKTTTCEFIVGSPQYYKYLTSLQQTAKQNAAIAAGFIPERGTYFPPCGNGGTQNIDYQIYNNYSFKWFNFFKLISLLGIISSLFIRYRQRI